MLVNFEYGSLDVGIQYESAWQCTPITTHRDAVLFVQSVLNHNTRKEITVELRVVLMSTSKKPEILGATPGDW